MNATETNVLVRHVWHGVECFVCRVDRILIIGFVSLEVDIIGPNLVQISEHVVSIDFFFFYFCYQY